MIRIPGFVSIHKNYKILTFYLHTVGYNNLYVYKYYMCLEFCYFDPQACYLERNFEPYIKVRLIRQYSR